MSILLYGCTAETLTKRIDKKLDGNCIRMMQVVMNKSWKQHPTKQQLYGHLPPISKPSKSNEEKMLDTAGEVRLNSEVTCSSGPLHTDEQVLDDFLELIYSSSVRTQDLVLKTFLKRLMIKTNGERKSGKSMLAAWDDDDDDDIRDILTLRTTEGNSKETQLHIQEYFIFYIHCIHANGEKIYKRVS